MKIAQRTPQPLIPERDSASSARPPRPPPLTQQVANSITLAAPPPPPPPPTQQVADKFTLAAPPPPPPMIRVPFSQGNFGPAGYTQFSQENLAPPPIASHFPYGYPPPLGYPSFYPSIPSNYGSQHPGFPQPAGPWPAFNYPQSLPSGYGPYMASDDCKVVRTFTTSQTVEPRAPPAVPPQLTFGDVRVEHCENLQIGMGQALKESRSG